MPKGKGRRAGGRPHTPVPQYWQGHCVPPTPQMICTSPVDKICVKICGNVFQTIIVSLLICPRLPVSDPGAGACVTLYIPVIP